MKPLKVYKVYRFIKFIKTTKAAENSTTLACKTLDSKLILSWKNNSSGASTIRRAKLGVSILKGRTIIGFAIIS